MSKQPIVLVVASRKGGVSKTTTAWNLAGSFVQKGQRVLVIDADPQGSMTQNWIGSEAYEQLPKERTLYAVFDDSYRVEAADVISETSVDELFLIPAHDALTKFNDGEIRSDNWTHEAISRLLRDVASVVDIVIIDTPPNLQLLTYTAMATAAIGRYGGVVTPLIPEDNASQGLAAVRRFIERVRREANPNLAWTGLCLTLVKRLAVHHVYESKIRDVYGRLVFDMNIPYASVFKEAIAARTPTTIFKPRTAGAKCVVALAEEIMERATAGKQQKEAA